MFVDRCNEKYLAQKLERSLHQVSWWIRDMRRVEMFIQLPNLKKKSDAVTKYKDMKCTFLFSF